MDSNTQSFSPSVFTGVDSRAAEISKVLKNTYLLLSATLLFSALMAFVGMMMNVPASPWIKLGGALALLWAVQKTSDSPAGLALVFVFTGWMGFWLAPMLNFFMAKAGGGLIVLQALGGTGLIFLSLSAYVLTTRKDFSFMRGFLFAGVMVVFFSALAMLVASYFFDIHIPMLVMALSAIIVLLCSALILYSTSEIIHGGETNYIRATVSLYLNIYNIFSSLMVLLGMSSDD